MESINKIIKLSNECLNCKVPFCSKEGCPIETKIPEFISKIKKNKFEESYNILQENNIMSDICSFICPSEKMCQNKCIKGIKGSSVEIKLLENFVNSWAKINNIEYNYNCKTKKNIKVAVIGSGPSGISCSVELTKLGYDVTIYEKETNIGGLLRYGIPDFRLSKDILCDLEKKLKKLNIKIVTNSEYGKDITINNLKKNGYKSIFLACGASKGITYKLSNNNSNIYEANDFLNKYHKSKIDKDLGTVAIIGGGNVAMDVSRICKKLNSKEVYVLYRGPVQKMSAREKEINSVIKENIKIMHLTKVLSCTHENNKLKYITCIKTETKENNIIEIESSEFNLNVDAIVFAIGNIPNRELFEKEGLLFTDFLLKVDENMMTNIKGVFAGGDLIQSKASVCEAIKTGKIAAENIEKYLNI